MYFCVSFIVLTAWAKGLFFRCLCLFPSSSRQRKWTHRTSFLDGNSWESKWLFCVFLSTIRSPFSGGISKTPCRPWEPLKVVCSASATDQDCVRLYIASLARCLRIADIFLASSLCSTQLVGESRFLVIVMYTGASWPRIFRYKYSFINSFTDSMSHLFSFQSRSRVPTDI